MFTKHTFSQWQPYLLFSSRQKQLRVKQPFSSTFTLTSVIVAGLIITLFIILRLWNITNYSVWGGETFIIDGVRLSWQGMFDYIIFDVVHPPLFYLLARAWLSVGETLLWIKLLPVFITLAGLIPLFLLGHELNLQPGEILLALLLVGVNGFLLHYAQEFRNYSLLFSLSLFSLWRFVRFFNETESSVSSILWLFIINLLLIYSHYFGWLVVGVEFATLLLWNRAKLLPFSLSVVGLMICFGPWSYVVKQAADQKGGLDSNLNWIPRPNFRSLVNLFAHFSGVFAWRWSKVAGTLLLGFPVAWWGWHMIIGSKKIESRYTLIFWWLVLVVFTPLVIIFIASQFLRQALWIDRYFIFVIAPYLLLVAVATFRLRPAWLKYTVLALITTWSVTAGLNDLRTNKVAWENPQVGTRIQWQEISQQLMRGETTSHNVNIYTLSTWSENRPTGDWAISTSMTYHFYQLREERFQLKYAGTPRKLVNLAAEESHFWVAFFELKNSNNEALLKSALTDDGYRFGTAIRETQGVNQLILLPVWSQQSENQTQ